MELREKVGNLPLQPGVYLFKDATGAILYVGKAQSLRSRVKSYFLESSSQDAKTGSLVREIVREVRVPVGSGIAGDMPGVGPATDHQLLAGGALELLPVG